MRLSLVLLVVLAHFFTATAQWGGGQLEVGTVINGNRTGQQGDYHVEYWKDNGSGTMTLKEGGNFSCEWGQVNNILFRKGIRPGSKEQVIVYSADYQPQGNSYLSIYGWFENPLVEYYIIECWGSWRPPGNFGKKGTVESDGGTYDIYQNSRTGPSIKGNTTFQQYWSVRQSKQTEGVIFCGNHFKAWEKAGMQIGSFYEVSFNVEAYQSPGGRADVQVLMTTESEYTSILPRYDRSGSSVFRIQSQRGIYNALGKKISMIPEMINVQNGHSVFLNKAQKSASGIFFLVPEEK